VASLCAASVFRARLEQSGTSVVYSHAGMVPSPVREATMQMETAIDEQLVLPLGQAAQFAIALLLELWIVIAWMVSWALG
jgi:hypothetical protein